MSKTEQFISEVDRVSAHNYHPIPAVISHAEGIWMTDVEGNKYIDMLSAYSAVNQGHRHPKIIKAMEEQAKKLTLTSRAFHNDQMGPFLTKLTKLTGYDKGLMMNTGAEAVETAIKAARRWGYNKKNVPANKAKIIVCEDNFHGRTTTIVGFSTDPLCQTGFGPYTPGFEIIPYDDTDALENAIDENTVAFLVEPIQGEAGVKVPSEGYLKRCREITKKHNVLLICDEIQTGFGRTGKMFCSEWDNVRPDIITMGKAMGGGVYPVSGIVADDEIMMAAFEPGNHGSTFGGNPMACAIASASIDVILDEHLAERAHEMGEFFRGELRKIDSDSIKIVRGRGLLTGLEFNTPCAHDISVELMKHGILAKDTHGTTIRFAPPLVITKDELAGAVEKIAKVIGNLNGK
ncbi:MAG: ornithine--oxo-acid transaminase [Deltaproteobacteria bacterium]|jgi:ornithine--oxo-acid transaminase|nr:ornithine--oxo-acid transaminase [Deltaproteobacteria bacterium]